MTVIESLSAIRLRLTELDLCGWLGAAQPGDIVEYHRGVLALDTMPRVARLPERDRAELARVRHRAMLVAERGLVHLVQRRHGPDDYSYLAVARPRAKSAPVSLSSLLSAEAA